MSTKFNVSHKTKFGRGPSHYPERLANRGLAKAPALAGIEGPSGLRARQERRMEETGVPWRVFGPESVPAESRAAVEPAPAKSGPGLAELTARLASHFNKAA